MGASKKAGRWETYGSLVAVLVLWKLAHPLEGLGSVAASIALCLLAAWGLTESVISLRQRSSTKATV